MDTLTRLILGIDFGRKGADLCLLGADGRELVHHRSCPNSPAGFAQAKALLLSHRPAAGEAVVEIGGEATSLYWLPFFWQLVHDPELAVMHPTAYLLNPLWVTRYKQSLPKVDKSDVNDPFYIADRVRTRPPNEPWQPQAEWLPLRFITRLRYHLAHDLSREKNLFQLYLFLRYSGYAPAKPFADLFGTTSRQLLLHPEQLAACVHLSEEERTDYLDELSHHRLPHPAENAQKLRQALQESFALDPALTPAVQQVLEILLDHITAIEQLIARLEAWIVADVQAHHPQVQWLDSVPGYGLVIAAGLCAEIGDLQRFFAGTTWDKRHNVWRPNNQRDVEDKVAKFAGLWWPRNQSGSFDAEDRPLARTGNRYLRYYLIEGAESLRRRLPEYTQYYERKFREVHKHAHQRAIVLTARKSLGLIVGLLHRKEPYRPKEAIAL
jgi:transposase